MNKSKLEVYEDVLRILSAKPLTVDAIAFEGNMDCTVLNKKLDFLLEYGLVEKVKCKSKTVYNLTYRGSAIYKTLALTKRLEQLQANIAAGEVETPAVPTQAEAAWKAKRKH